MTTSFKTLLKKMLEKEPGGENIYLKVEDYLYEKNGHKTPTQDELLLFTNTAITTCERLLAVSGIISEMKPCTDNLKEQLENLKKTREMIIQQKKDFPSEVWQEDVVGVLKEEAEDVEDIDNSGDEDVVGETIESDVDDTSNI